MSNLNLNSIYKNIGGGISMPSFQGRNLYMHKTRMDDLSFPSGFSDYVDTVDTILNKVSNRNDVCYITIDERNIPANNSHRRGGAHVDFNWFESIKAWGTGLWGNKLGRHGGHGKRFTEAEMKEAEQWFNTVKNGGMLLASNKIGCQVYKGEIIGEIGEGGDCSNVDLSNMQSELMNPNEVYYLNALGVHESLKLTQDTERSLIRINFHPDYVFQD